MTEKEMRAFIIARICSRITGAGERRDEALRAVLGIASPGLNDEALARLVEQTAQIPPALYERWAGMFAERLLATVPHAQIQELCRNTPESNASLQLLYSMFMESARMETVIGEDLHSLLPNP